MSPEPLDERYFKWLYRQVASTRITNPERTYWSLLRELHSVEFTWFIPNDDNRVEDGKELRIEFYNGTGIDYDHDWDILGCSILEMMVALSRRLSFNGGGVASEWFWTMINNLGLSGFNDHVMDTGSYFTRVRRVCKNLVNRTYNYQGKGGLFPLMEAPSDQSQTEIWEQMNNYLSERMG